MLIVGIILWIVFLLLWWFNRPKSDEKENNQDLKDVLSDVDPTDMSEEDLEKLKEAFLDDFIKSQEAEEDLDIQSKVDTTIEVDNNEFRTINIRDRYGKDLAKIWDMVHQDNKKEVPIKVLSGDLIEKGSKEIRLKYYRDKLFSGIAYDVFDNGQLNYEINYKDGIRHGATRYWYENGQLSTREYYINGKEDGIFQHWYQNGQLMSKEGYKKGKEQGLWQTWTVDGELFVEFLYRDGKLIESRNASLDNVIDWLVPKNGSLKEFHERIQLLAKINKSKRDV